MARIGIDAGAGRWAWLLLITDGRSGLERSLCNRHSNKKDQQRDQGNDRPEPDTLRSANQDSDTHSVASETVVNVRVANAIIPTWLSIS